MKSGADDSNAAASIGCAVPGLESVSGWGESGSVGGDESENIVEGSATAIVKNQSYVMKTCCKWAQYWPVGTCLAYGPPHSFEQAIYKTTFSKVWAFRYRFGSRYF